MAKIIWIAPTYAREHTDHRQRPTCDAPPSLTPRQYKCHRQTFTVDTSITQTRTSVILSETYISAGKASPVVVRTWLIRRLCMRLTPLIFATFFKTFIGKRPFPPFIRLWSPIFLSRLCEMSPIEFAAVAIAVLINTIVQITRLCPSFVWYMWFA